ncbi:hypothetical protein [Yersinia mollaretii]|uniref:hypothetical protein n=1 Tax=Yersinia mollaretii TaxID=33060 RepID=UPI0021BDAD3C|nr:hypothetical protein [Yersinia mollaretii]MDN0111250.1 hypothetical protein [Yersinia mollaretii]
MTVGVMVANSNLENPVSDNAVVTAARDHILPLAPVVGASLYTPPVAKIVLFHIRLTPDTPEVSYAVIAELRAIFLRDEVPGECWITLALTKRSALPPGSISMFWSARPMMFNWPRLSCPLWEN